MQKNKLILEIEEGGNLRAYKKEAETKFFKLMLKNFQNLR